MRRRGVQMMVGAVVAAVASLLAPIVNRDGGQVHALGQITTRLMQDDLSRVAGTAVKQLMVYSESGKAADWSAYKSTRASVAIDAGRQLSIDASTLENAWAAADFSHQTAVMAALSQVGTPYRRNSSTPHVGFDCSGLTAYAWGVAGVTLDRQSGAQIRAAAPRAVDEAEAGDLVQYPGHVMMYLGVDRAIVHAVQPGQPVEVTVVATRRTLKFGHPD